MSLSELVFSDLFVAAESGASWFKPTPDSLRCQPVPEACLFELERLRKFLEEQNRGNDFRINWPISGGTAHPLRVRKMMVAGGEVIFVCRRYRLPPGPLRSLGVPMPVTEKLMDPGARAGLYVFLGKTGAGKSTTAASFVKERLSRYGGVCWTVESPIELQMQGKNGEGWCYQTEVDSDDAVGDAIKNMMRATPNIIFIGEVRGRVAVREAINAATSGHIVVTTFHAGDLISGLSRLTALAGDEDVRMSLADAFQFGIHLSLYNADPEAIPRSAYTVPDSKGTGTPPRILSVEPLWKNEENASSIMSTIRAGDFHLLKSEIALQRRKLMNGPLPS